MRFLKHCFYKALVWAVIVSPCFAVAQQTITGTLINNITQEKIQGAVIQVQGTFLSTVSDAEGRFEFNHLKQAEAVLLVSHISFNKLSLDVRFPASPLEIKLVPRIISANEVTVSALRANDQAAIAFYSVQKEELENNNLGQDIPYLLNSTPSLVATSDAGTGIGYSGLRIRGSDPSRVNVTINGIPVNDAESHTVYWVDLPDLASSVDNIQIQRGVGTSTNGAGAFGGSINIQTTKTSLAPYGGINFSGGSYGTTKTSFDFGTGTLHNKFFFDGRFSMIKSDGYIDRATADLKSLYLSGGYIGNKSSLRLIVFTGLEKTYQAWYGVPRDSLTTNRTFNPAGMYVENGEVKYYDNQTDNYQQDNYQLHYSLNLNKNWNANAALHYTKGKGYYEEYRQGDAFADYGLPGQIIDNDTIQTADLVRQRWLDNDFYGITYSLQYEKDALNMILGGAYNEYRGDHFGKIIWSQYAVTFPKDYEYYQNDAVKNDFNIFSKFNYTLKKNLNLFADLQYRRVNYSFLGYDNSLQQVIQDESLNFFNPKAGVQYEISSTKSVYASVGVGHKEPMRDDYVNSPPGSRPGPEAMTDIELGYKASYQKVQVTLGGYYMIYKDQLVVTGKINDIGLYQRQNVPNSFRRGVEFELAYKPLNTLKFEFNATLSENKIEKFNEYIDDYDNGIQIQHTYENTDIAFSPDMISSGILSYLPFKNFEFSLIGKYVGQQFLDNTQNKDRELSAYFTTDLRLNYSLSKIVGKNMSFTLAVYNLFDSMYESNGYTFSYVYGGSQTTENYYYPQAGRNFLAGIQLKF